MPVRAVWSARAMCVVCGLCASVGAWSEIPEEARHSLDMARTLVAAGDWSSALEAYGDHLRHLTSRDFRDKKTFEWILDAFEKSLEKPIDYEPLKAVVKSKLPSGRSKPDPVMTWRLHHMLARMAQREGNTKEYETRLQLAMDAYPEMHYSMPEKESLLQHLYNELALSKAQTDVDAAEKSLLDSFAKDQRFDYVYLAPWKSLHDNAGTPERYAALRERVIEAYGKKAENLPAKADMYTYYRRQLAGEIEAPKSSAVIFGTEG